jgi:hypothetical protein
MYYSNNPEQDAQDYLRMIDNREEAEPCCHYCEITNVQLTEREIKNRILLVCDECYDWHS